TPDTPPTARSGPKGSDAPVSKPVAPLTLSKPSDFAGCGFMADLLDVPVDATWPRLMTGPHPRAVGSYGLDLEELSRERGTVLRWWQRLALRRILEHDAAGDLVWPEWIVSAARQSGKSILVRELSMWRLSRAGLVGEAQSVSLVSSVIRTAALIQQPARTWAKLHREEGWRTRELNGGQAVEAPDGGLWAVHSPTSIYGSTSGLALVDEAHRVEPRVVSEALEPTLSERKWGQLGLISTAHSRPTGLVVERRLAAMDDPDVLLMEWSAAPGCELEDVAEWRLASPHWHGGRESLIARALKRALTSNSLIDGEDPVSWFRAQWLNQWPTVV